MTIRMRAALANRTTANSMTIAAAISWLVCTIGFTQAYAQDEPSTQTDTAILVLGVAAVPEFVGSNQLQAAPLIVSRFRTNGKQVQITGTQVKLALIERDGWLLGPMLGFVTSRDNSTTNETIATFEPTELSFELGAAIEHNRSLGNLAEGLLNTSMAIKKPITGDWKGTSLTLGTEYSWAATFMLRLAVGGSLTVGDDNYAMSRFGVTTINANNSGLTAFNPTGGLTDATVSLRSIISFSPRWGIFTRIAYTQLLNDAKSSPIISESGSADQWFVGLGIFRNLSR